MSEYRTDKAALERVAQFLETREQEEPTALDRAKYAFIRHELVALAEWITEVEAEEAEDDPHWVRLISADGTNVTLWCINTGRTHALEVYEREVAKAPAGAQVEWGRGEAP